MQSRDNIPFVQKAVEVLFKDPFQTVNTPREILDEACIVICGKLQDRGADQELLTEFIQNYEDELCGRPINLQLFNQLEILLEPDQPNEETILMVKVGLTVSGFILGLPVEGKIFKQLHEQCLRIFELRKPSNLTDQAKKPKLN